MLKTTFWKTFWKNEDGIGTLELLLIVAILVVIAIAFRKWILKWVGDLFNKTNDNVKDLSDLNPDNLGPSATP